MYQMPVASLPAQSPVLRLRALALSDSYQTSFLYRLPWRGIEPAGNTAKTPNDSTSETRDPRPWFAAISRKKGRPVRAAARSRVFKALLAFLGKAEGVNRVVGSGEIDHAAADGNATGGNGRGDRRTAVPESFAGFGVIRIKHRGFALGARPSALRAQFVQTRRRPKAVAGPQSRPTTKCGRICAATRRPGQIFFTPASKADWGPRFPDLFITRRSSRLATVLSSFLELEKIFSRR